MENNKMTKQTELLLKHIQLLMNDTKSELKEYLLLELRRIHEELTTQISPCMNVEEAANYLNVSKAIVYRMISKKVLPAIRLEPTAILRVHRDDINLILDRRKAN